MATLYIFIDIMNILIKKGVQQQLRFGTSEGSFTFLHITGRSVVGVGVLLSLVLFCL